MVCLTSVVYSLCSGENVKPAAVNLALVYLYIMSCFYITLMDVQISFPKAMWLTYKKELKLFATSVSYSWISEAPAYTVCAMRAHIVVLFRCVFGVFTTETNQRWKLDRLVVVPLLFSSCSASQTTLFLSTNFAVNITVDIFGRCWSDAFVMFWIWLFQLEFVARIIHFIRLFNFFESVCTYVILIIVFNDVLMGGASWSFINFVNILFSNHWFVAHVNHIKSMILPSHWFNRVQLCFKKLFFKAVSMF